MEDVGVTPVCRDIWDGAPTADEYNFLEVETQDTGGFVEQIYEHANYALHKIRLFLI